MRARVRVRVQARVRLRVRVLVQVRVRVHARTLWSFCHHREGHMRLLQFTYQSMCEHKQNTMQ